MIELRCMRARAGKEEKAVVRRAVEAALEREGRPGADVGVLLTDDAGIWKMNRRYRNVDRPTDVLSFPSWEGSEEFLQPPDGALGDIAISLERARAQAAEYGHALSRELSFLAVHGTLHLLGYDHEDEAARAHMFARQAAILEEMGERR